MLRIYNKKIMSHKTVICNSVIENKKCSYGYRCKFAHSIEEQNCSDELNERIFTMIDNKESFKDFSLTNTKNFASLKKLTKLCLNCINCKCTGGINCKHGSYSKKYYVCYEDLMYGKCLNREVCYKVHLTDYDLTPHNKQVNSFKIIPIINQFVERFNNTSFVIKGNVDNGDDLLDFNKYIIPF